jgi:hypothetical protein
LRGPFVARLDDQCRAAPPPRPLLGVREGPSEPPIHAVDAEGDQDETLCGLAIDTSLGVLGMPEPYMSAAAIAEMLTAQVGPCRMCQALVSRAEGPPGEL